MRTDTLLFHQDFVAQPYWWDAAPPETAREALPISTDVAIVGSGYCGMSAAIELARQGLRVAVLDSAEIGSGGSTRSGGMVSSGQKLALTNAVRGVSAQRLAQLMTESLASYDYLKAFVRAENLDADLQITGRFFGAYTPAHFERLCRQGHLLREKTGVTVHVIPREMQRQIVGSDYYYGGIVVDEYGGLHTAKYHRSLRRLARECGVTLHSHAGVERIDQIAVHGGATSSTNTSTNPNARMPDTPLAGGAQASAGATSIGAVRRHRFALSTSRGKLLADKVLIATNGYTGKLLPFLTRRILPVASYQIATEPLPEGLMDALNPGRRMISDSKRNLFYTRPSPDGTRMIFGSRPAIGEVSEREAARLLYAKMVQLWPALRDIRVTHAWKGFVAMTSDKLAHIGEHDGIFYALGCNGNGVALMSYLGKTIAQQMTGSNRTTCAFAEGDFPISPAGIVKSVAVPAGSALYDLNDRWSARTRGALA